MCCLVCSNISEQPSRGAFGRELHAPEVHGVDEHGSGTLARLEGAENGVLAQGCGSVETCPGQDRLEWNLRVMAVDALELLYQ